MGYPISMGRLERTYTTIKSIVTQKRYEVYVRGNLDSIMSCEKLQEFVADGVHKTKRFNIKFIPSEKYLKRVEITYVNFEGKQQ